MGSEEFVQKAKGQRERKRFDEALISARQAVKLDDENADAHWQVALCLIQLDQLDAAVASLERLTELAPHFGHGWSRLGSTLVLLDRKQEAYDHFTRAIIVQPDNIEALRGFSELAEAKGDEEAELKALVALESVTELTPYQMNRQGQLHLEREDYFPALRCFKDVAKRTKDPAGLFNMGLVYQNEAVSQDADAVDCWQLALLRDPSHKKCPKQIKEAIEKTAKLRAYVLALPRHSPLDVDQQFQHYLNPIELLDFPPDTTIEALDAKTVLKAKKRLLQEIELEDGTIAWMPGLKIDRSRAIRVCEELNEPTLLRHHYHVFANRRLMDFLTRGSLKHFLVDDQSPIVTLHLLQDDSAFAKWLSPYFASQFGLVLSKSVTDKNTEAVEAVMDGRRWVEPEDDDRCFESTQVPASRLLEPLRAYEKTVEKKKPDKGELIELLYLNNIPQILGLLPVAFYKLQEEATMAIRSIAVDCYNIYADAELAKSVLLHSRDFALKSLALREHIAEDRKKLNELIAAAKKDEAHITFGKKECTITKDGIAFDGTRIAANEVKTIRWGSLTTNTSSGQTIKFSMNIGDGLMRNVAVGWTATSNVEKQQEHFRALTGATMAYLLPGVIDRINAGIESNSGPRIGPLVLLKEGIQFQVAGWFSTKPHLCPWARVKSTIDNGDAILTDLTNSKAKAILPLSDIDNALALHLIVMRHNKNRN